MAIRRCPYCKAIIDEADKYCNNCGTQLLFPEDEYVEEEIPGDKIIEEDEEAEEEEELFDEQQESARFAERSEEGEEREELEEEEEFEEELEEREEGDVTAEKFGAEEEGETAEDIERPGERPRGEFVRPPKEEELRKKYEVALEDDELIFKTKDLEGLTKAVDEGKKEVDRFISSVRDDGEEEVEEEGEKKEEVTGREDTREDLPPWASEMKGAPPAVLEAEQEEGGEETGTTAAPSQGWTADSGIGVPERVTQTGLPVTDAAVTGRTAEHAAEEEEEEEEEEELEREREEEELKEETKEEGALKKEVGIKAKFVDLIFITALWLISLWFTAEVIDVSFFQLFAKSPLPVFGFYLILLLLYFFLFIYFLGETLGDHYFSEED